MNPAPDILVILGPTASGKTGLGIAACRALNGELLSADSRQVYRGLDLGSGKDLDEYGETVYHLIDIVDPGTEYSLFAFARDFATTFGEVTECGRLPILVGGTGLYLEAVLNRYRLVEVPENPALRRELAEQPLEVLQQRLLALRPDPHNTTDLLDRDRLVRAIEIADGEQQTDARPVDLPELNPVIIGLRWPRELLHQRITRRLHERLEAGMITEVENLHAAGVSWETLEFYGLEYRFIAQHLQGQLSRNDMVQKLNSAINQFAKRQESWFRRMERNGTCIRWIDGEDPEQLQTLLAIWQETHP